MWFPSCCVSAVHCVAGLGSAVNCSVCKLLIISMFSHCLYFTGLLKIDRKCYAARDHRLQSDPGYCSKNLAFGTWGACATSWATSTPLYCTFYDKRKVRPDSSHFDYIGWEVFTLSIGAYLNHKHTQTEPTRHFSYFINHCALFHLWNVYSLKLNKTNSAMCCVLRASECAQVTWLYSSHLWWWFIH